MAMEILRSTFPPPTKRKLDPAAPHDPPKKRTRVGATLSPIPNRLPLEPHEGLVAELRPKYHVATFSVISSTSINKRIGQILDQLGRFHPTDLNVLPGVVLMHSRSGDAAKMVSVIELARRQLQERGQKWYQYNRLYEVESESPHAGRNTVIEETVLEGATARDEQLDESGQVGEDDDDFDATPTVFERAVLGPPRPEHRLYMSTFLSRVPIPELRSKSFITSQTNSDLIDQKWRREFGT